MSSSRSLSLLVLAGCNPLLGIKDTDPAPPTFYDGGIDAARGCPAHGTQPDTYSPYVHEAYVQDCTEFSSVPAGRAIARCIEGPVATIHEGVAGQPLPSAGVTLSGGITGVETPRLSPDGQRILVVSYPSGGGTSIRMLVRQGDGSWVDGASGIPTSNNNAVRLSTIAHAPTGDRVLVLGRPVTEWELQGSSWVQIGEQLATPIGQDWQQISMSTDGLRVLVTDGDGVYYADRTDTTQSFGVVVSVSGVPAITDIFMTDDCSRVYMSGFGALFYVQQN